MRLKVAFYFVTVLLLCGLSESARAQEAPAVDVFGGYSFLSVDTNGLATSRQNANGWESSISATAHNWLAVEGDLSGYYKSYAFDLTPFGFGSLNVAVRDYAFGAGPRINVRPLFVHALFGVDHLSGSALGVTLSQNSFAEEFGGGLQVPAGKHFAIRLSADYVMTHHNLFEIPGTSYTQNNVRASVGLVFRFGGQDSSRIAIEGPPSSPRAARRSQVPAEEVPSLGMRVYSRSGGIAVASFTDPSVAAAAGLKVGDIIMSIDNQAVTNAEQAEKVVTASKIGTVHLNYFEGGILQSSKNIKVR